MGIEDDIIAAHEHVKAIDRYRAERDDLIRSGIAQGITAYRIAQITGLAQSAVHKIKEAGVTLSPWRSSNRGGGAVLEADASDGAQVVFFLDDFDDEIRPTFVVFSATGRTATSSNTEDWPLVEEYVPRRAWPKEMYAGKSQQARKPDAAILDAITQYRADLDDERE